MFDAHYHLGKCKRKGLVCTSKPLEYPLLDTYDHPFAGLLPPQNDPLALISYLRTHIQTGMGEIGLDKRFPEGEKQQQLLSALLEENHILMRKITIHSVQMTGRTLAILREIPQRVPMLWHGCAASGESAKEAIRLGMTISLRPSCRMARSYRDLLTLPFLLETDLPATKESGIILQHWYETVALDMGISYERLEEILDERSTIFTA